MPSMLEGKHNHAIMRNQDFPSLSTYLAPNLIHQVVNKNTQNTLGGLASVWNDSLCQRQSYQWNPKPTNLSCLMENIVFGLHLTKNIVFLSKTSFFQKH